ncbi:MAG TPA: SPASM domain-containing protein [Bacteriovoracaceae bacterium]|nr:SPASM domain-containing protein [Bacteriovoracaceae bacterium]
MANYKLEDIAQETLDVRERLRAKGLDENNFCLVPFTTIILEPDGQVGVCRHKGSDFPIGHITKNTISEIWNGEKARQWRREFLNGTPGFCSQEVKHRHCQHCPENNKLLDYIELNETQTQPILKLTANFNGKCNLQCQMCDIWQKPNGLYDQINFWEPAKKNIFPYLKEVDLLSGEPFIQGDTYRLIDEISEVNPDCFWIFTTNAHWKLTPKVKESLNKIKIKNIILSIDSLDKDIYHKIRYPGDLNFVLENVDNLINYNKERVNIGLNEIRFIWNFLVQKDNYHEVPKVIDYIQSKGILPLITFLYVPSEFSLLEYGPKRRAEILEEMILKSSKEHLLRSMRVITPLIDSLLKIDKAYVLDLFDKKMKEQF